MNQTVTVPQSELDRQRTYMQAVKALLVHPCSVYLQTFGCQQNEADSERLAGMASEMGYTVIEQPEGADLILVNTCAIREHAELRALSITGQFKHLKAANPALKIGICGCMVTQAHRKEDIRGKYPYVDFLFDTHMLYRFPEILYTALTAKKRGFWLEPSEGNIAEGLPIRRESSFRAWVSIMYGCNNFCTYCVVPYVRGRERSRLPEKILQEVRELAEEGYKEITLLGQNVNSYGKDLGIGYDFSDLLRDVDAIEGDFLIRFMTSHPKDATKKLIDTIAASRKIAHTLHLPLQAGSDRILRAMNRHYDRSHYLSLVKYCKEKLPDASLTTDIIVGFPTETEKEFEETLAVLREVRYDQIFSFCYSPRRGTPAAEMEGQIPEKVKSERMGRLLALENEISKENNDKLVGKILRVLVEGTSKSDPSKLTARTEQNRPVHFTGDSTLIGRYVFVTIERAEAYSLYGSLPTEEEQA